MAAAEHVGVTRLADLTGLDRLGVPVWQAVRPWSRALSVAQGKGLDAERAQLGAVMESIECACAEDWAPPPIIAAWRELPEAARSHRYDDFAVTRGGGPALEMPQPWALAQRLDGAGALHVAYDAVSLDLTRAGCAGIDGGSTGLAAHLTKAAAVRAGLHEAIERDAIARWHAGQGSLLHAANRIAIGSITFGWFEALLARCDANAVTMRVYAVPAVIDLPVFVATLSDASAADAAHAAVFGAAAHGDPETALLGAVLEAVQSRLTIIAGARDDLDLYSETQRNNGVDLGGLMPPGMRARDFASVASFGPDDDAAAVTVIVAALSRVGFDRAAVVDLAPPGFPVAVVKVLVPGLATPTRARA